MIAAIGLAIAAVLPHLGALSALMSSYSREPSGWYALSLGSYLARAAIAVMLLTPITLLMGGTLTLLIRHLVRQDLETGGRRIALLYGINTAGAALGCALTDFALVPAWGLWRHAAGRGAAQRGGGRGRADLTCRASAQTVRLKPDTTQRRKRNRADEDGRSRPAAARTQVKLRRRTRHDSVGGPPVLERGRIERTLP